MNTKPLMASLLASALLLAASKTIRAQAGCSPQDLQVLNAYSEEILQTLRGGSWSALAELAQRMSARLSPACNQALAARQHGGNRGAYDSRGSGIDYGREVVRDSIFHDLAKDGIYMRPID